MSLKRVLSENTQLSGDDTLNNPQVGTLVARGWIRDLDPPLALTRPLGFWDGVDLLPRNRRRLVPANSRVPTPGTADSARTSAA